MNYTIIGSFSSEIKEEVQLFHFWFNSYLNSQISFEKLKKKLNSKLIQHLDLFQDIQLKLYLENTVSFRKAITCVFPYKYME